MFSYFKLLFYVIFVLNTCKINADSSAHKRLCANEACTEPISLARTLQGYGSIDEGVLSFPANAHVKIFSKPPKNSPSDFFEGEINGKRGFIPKRLVREVKVLKRPSFEVGIEPDAVQTDYEVVDGTTIYNNGGGVETNEQQQQRVEVTATPDLNVSDTNEETKAKSLVDNVLSSLNNLLPGGSEEDEEEDDYEDDDDDEEDEEESEEDLLDAEKEAASLLKRTNVVVETIDGVVETNANQIDSTEAGVETKASQDVVVETGGNFENGNKANVIVEDLPDKIEDFTKEEAVKLEMVPTGGVLSQIKPISAAVVENQEVLVEPKIEESTTMPEIPATEIPVQDSPLIATESPLEVASELQKNKESGQEKLLEEENFFEKQKGEEIVFDEQEEQGKILEEPHEQEKIVSEKLEEQEKFLEEEKVQEIFLEKQKVEEKNLDEQVEQKKILEEPQEQEKIVSVNLEEPKKLLEEKFLEGQEKNLEEQEKILGDPQEQEKIVSEESEEQKQFLEEEVQEKIVSEEPETETASEGLMSGIYNSMFGGAAQVTENQQNDAVEELKNLLDDGSKPTEEKLEIVEEKPKETQEFFGQESEVKLEDLDNVHAELFEEKLKEALQTNETPDFIVEEPKEQLEDLNENVQAEKDTPQNYEPENIVADVIEEKNDDLISKLKEDNVNYCTADCEQENPTDESTFPTMDVVTYDLISVIVITAITVVTFLLGCVYIDKSRKEAPLIAKINKLEKDLLVALKENQLLTEKSTIDDDVVNSEAFEKLTYELALAQNAKASLEEQIENLEKELENSTEVAMELNRMLTDVLSSQNGSDTIIANVEQLQRQLVEQQDTINTVTESLSEKNTENHELRLELEISNKKVTELQAELDKMVLNLLKIEEEKEQQQNTLESEIVALKQQTERLGEQTGKEVVHLRSEIENLQRKLSETQRNLDVKMSEFQLLEDSVKAANSNSDDLLQLSSVKAELMQLKRENQVLNEHLRQLEESKGVLQQKTQSLLQEIEGLQRRYEEADKEKLEAQTKLQVLSVYFKEKEAQLQKELNKQEAMWNEQKGEANSTIERIKYMQGELQNYKAQNESLKQEIVAQEVELKSQISILEKKAHENWVTARQAERRLEDAKQEAAQLRNRLTMRERTINEEKGQNRIQSPLEQNGDLGLSSPLHVVDTPSSPPLLYGTRDHMTTSPSLHPPPPPPGLPPFLPPPPPGVPFMPPPLPHGVVAPPPFMPPPPALFPGDHRPPPLGRMSSPPPLNSRYSPDSRAFSPYDRNSPSPPYDSEYGPPSPPPHRGYSPYNGRGDDRRDYKRAPPIRNAANRHNKGSTHSSASNESLEKINNNRHHHNKV